MTKITNPVSGQLPYSRPSTTVIKVLSCAVFQTSDGRSVAPGMDEEVYDFEWIQ